MSGFGSQAKRTQAMPISEPVTLGPWPKGLNNTANNDAYDADELVEAVGVVVDRLGVLHSAGALKKVADADGVFYRNESVCVLVSGTAMQKFDGGLGASIDLGGRIECVVPIPEGFLVYAAGLLKYVSNALYVYVFGSEKIGVSATYMAGGKMPPGVYSVAAAAVGPFGYTHAAVSSITVPESKDGELYTITVGGAACTFISNSGDTTLMACNGSVDGPPINVEFYPYVGCGPTTGSNVMAVVGGMLAVAFGNEVKFTKPFNYHVTDDSDAYVFDFDVKYLIGVGSDLYACGDRSYVVVTNCMTDAAVMGRPVAYSVLPGSAITLKDGKVVAMTDRGLVSLAPSGAAELNNRVVVRDITSASLIDCDEYVIVAASQDTYADRLQFISHIERA